MTTKVTVSKAVASMLATESRLTADMILRELSKDEPDWRMVAVWANEIRQNGLAATEWHPV